MVMVWAVLGAAAANGQEAKPRFEPDDAGFRERIVPFLKTHCLRCHGKEKQEGQFRVDRQLKTDFLDLATKEKWGEVVNVLNSHEMPPESEPQPKADETAAIVDWITQQMTRAELVRRERRIVLRRLNRDEYRNTIRDLVGVDFDPTEDFPADDIGHGFDNIGDVLTLSPVLMERYLAAAESIMSRAIVPNPPPPPKRHLSTRYSEPAGPNIALEGNFRPISSSGDSPIATGPLHTPYQWEAEGEYVFRSRVYATREGGAVDDAAPVRVAVLVAGEGVAEPASDEQAAQLAGQAVAALRPFRVLETLEIKTSDPKQAQRIEVRVPPMAGRQRMAIALVKPADGQPPVKLFVEYLALEGPLDTRPASHRRLLAVAPDKPVAEQTREALARFATRAYRRPPTDDELTRLVKLVEVAQANGEKWEGAMQMAMQAVLCSPKFLFRVELDDRPEAPESRPLDEFQLASRLSYFLWSSLPDDALLEEARAGTLAKNLEPQVRRMLADPKADALVSQFALQWLQVKRLETFAPDAKQFPQFNERLRGAMLEETSRFFASVMREDRSILDLLDADYTFLNEPLARLYGIADTQGNLVGKKAERPGGQPLRGREFQRVALQDRTRGGLVTQASILAVTSNPTRTSPVKRGRWILEQLLGEPPPAPPPNVPELPNDEQAAAGASLRERLEIHRRNPSCANCHEKMDPLGFALENYDAIGAFRTKDGAFPIDPAGRLPDGTTFQGPEDLKSILKERKGLFARSLIEKMLTYGLGRGVEYYDRPTIERIASDLEAHDYRFSRLIVGIVASDPFRLRRGSDVQ